MFIHTYIYIYIYTHMCIYIYIEREIYRYKAHASCARTPSELRQPATVSI